MSLKKSLLEISKTLDLFVNLLTSDGRYSFLNRDNLTQPIQMQLSQQQKLFSKFVSAVLKSRLNFEQFQNKMTHLDGVVPDLRTQKNVVR